MLLELLHNVSTAVLAGLALGALPDVVRPVWRWPLSVGVLLGGAALLVTASPVTTPTGATLDGRAGPVLFAGFLAGPMGGFLAATIGAAGRLMVGGPFVFSGVLVYFLYGAAGFVLRKVRKDDLERPLAGRVVLELAVLSWFVSGSMFFLISPDARAWHWLGHEFPLIVVANTAGGSRRPQNVSSLRRVPPASVFGTTTSQ